MQRTILATITEGDLQRPDFFRMIGCEMVLGRPKATPTTVHYVVLIELPKERTSFEVLNRLSEVGVGVISPHPVAGALLLLTLAQAVQFKELSVPPVILVGDEEPLLWKEIFRLQPLFLIIQAKAKELFVWLKNQKSEIPVIFYLSGNDRVDGPLEGHGVWLQDPPGLETRCQLSFSHIFH